MHKVIFFNAIPRFAETIAFLEIVLEELAKCHGLSRADGLVKEDALQSVLRTTRGGTSILVFFGAK